MTKRDLAPISLQLPDQGEPAFENHRNVSKLLDPPLSPGLAYGNAPVVWLPDGATA
jgi:hypothetical protein